VMGVKLSWFVVTATCKDTGSGFKRAEYFGFRSANDENDTDDGKSQSAVWSHFYEQSSHV
jgi:hypothetical protein